MNKNLEIWEDIFQNNEWGKYPSLAVVRFVARNFYKVPNRKDIRILELGCGTGANLWYCAREGFSVIGLDGSKTAINRMIDRFEKENLVVITRLKCEFRNGNVQAVLAFNTYYV